MAKAATTMRAAAVVLSGFGLRGLRPGADPMRRIAAAGALALLLTAGLVPSPASAGRINGCCICQGCATPPATQCFESPAQGCETQCSVLNCAAFSDTAISCGQQPPCPSFSAPAPAPALAPVGLAVAALALAGIGRLAIRRR